MPDRIIFKDSGIEIEFPSEPATPIELADLMVKLRHARDSFASTHLSDKAIQTLVQLAFNLSMREDEGRFPKLRLISGTLDDSRLVAKFATPIEFSNVHELRRVAPVASSPDLALLVAESSNGNLHCPGLANIGHLGLQSKPGRPEIVPVGGQLSFRIWIEGPGHLFVQETATTVELRAGRVRLVMSAFSTIPALREMASRVGEALHNKAMELIDGVDGAEKYFGGHWGLSRILNTILSRLLASCLELRHGGAFLVLPVKHAEHESFDVSFKFPLKTPDLGEDLAHYWATHVQASDSKKEGVKKYDHQLVKCNQSKARLLTNLDAVSSMSAADGCVVMTEQLRILGFGGNIAVSEADCKAAQTEVRLTGDNPCDLAKFLGQIGGQRHQSAARFIIKHNDAVAFVVSQDGELTVFASDAEGFVRAYQTVDPSMSPDTD